MNLKLISTLSLIFMTGVTTETLAKFRAGPLGDDGKSVQNILKRPLQKPKTIERKGSSKAVRSKLEADARKRSPAPQQKPKNVEKKSNRRSSSTNTSTTAPKLPSSQVPESGTRAPIHKPAARAHHTPKGVSFPRAHVVPQGMNGKAPRNVHATRRVHGAPGYVHGTRGGIYAPNRVAPKRSFGANRRGR